MARLRRSAQDTPGIDRLRRGRGFSYRYQGKPVSDQETLDRIRALVLPPAWREVWICPDPRGHLQATGVDAAGRRQYRYHDQWRARRDAAKFRRMLDVAKALPAIRQRVTADLSRRTLSKPRVLAGAVRILDSAVIRIGGEGYAQDDPQLGEATFGLATLRRDHVSVTAGTTVFCFAGKGGSQIEVTVPDRALSRLVARLLERDDTNPELLAYHADEQWHDVRTQDVNEYLGQISGIGMTAKDFRTWHATVAAAVSLACCGKPANITASRKAVAQAMRDVAELLDNTPAVARKSYVDPKLLDLFQHGETIDWPSGVSPQEAFSDRPLWTKAESATLGLLS